MERKRKLRDVTSISGSVPAPESIIYRVVGMVWWQGNHHCHSLFAVSCFVFFVTPKCLLSKNIWAPSPSIPSWQILTAHALPFRGARDLAFCLKVPLDSLLVWVSSEGSGETARMRRLAWTFAARIGCKYQIRLTRSIWLPNKFKAGRI